MLGRRSARLPIVIPVTIQGTDNTGQGFKESTWTICVNRQGAKIATFHQLPVGGQILVANPVLGRSAKAQVVWVSAKRYREDPYEMGVELTEAINLWAVKHPPEDWQRTVSLEPGPHGYEPALRPAVSGTAPGAGAAALDSRVEALEARWAEFGLQIDSRLRARLEEWAKQIQQLEEEARSARTVEERLRALEDRVRSSSAEAEALRTQEREHERGWPEEVEKTLAAIREAGQRAAEAAAEVLSAKLEMTLEERLRQETRVASARLVEETRKRLQDEAATLAEALRQDASGRLTKLVEEHLAQAARELQARQSQPAEQAREQLVVVVQSAAADLTEKLRRVAEEMKVSLHSEVEQSLAKSAEQLIARWTHSFEEQARTAAERAQKSFETQMQHAQEQVESVLASAALRFHETCEQEANEAKKIVALRADSLGLATEAAVARLRAAYQDIESDFRATAESAPGRLAEISTSALESFQGEMQRTLRALQEKGGKETAAQIDRIAADLLETSTQELHRQTEGILGTLVSEIKGSGKALVEDTERQLGAVRAATVESLTTMYKQLGAGAIVLKDWTDQAKADLQASLQKSVEAFQKQLSDLMKTAFERRSRERDVLPEELLNRLRQAARVFQDRSLGVETKAHEAAAKPAETPASQAQKKTDEYLDLVIEQLKKPPAQAMDEETKAFRKKLAEALEGFQTSTRKGSPHGH